MRALRTTAVKYEVRHQVYYVCMIFIENIGRFINVNLVQWRL